MSFKILFGLVLLGLASIAAAGCASEPDFHITFYGLPDSESANALTAYDCGHNNIPGGTGTYNDPLTFATAPGEFAKCEIIYLPYLRKYLRFEDVCEQCITDFKSDRLHIDIWTTSASNGGSNQIGCEDSLTPNGGQTVITSPPSNLPVSSGMLFDGTCHTSNIYNNVLASSLCSIPSSSSLSKLASGASSS
ncbi:hypothetical protein BO71DRAFT_458377 [Aspergillus ellipticus CBS 707.79]|uniref:Uncharacterized protein n=1 Tax=Aspergillus ellipticus CBS 707.79 TaxID=1448320 RepID=A0A319D3N8_9EURO|nr:hypothetical protein BO71DRAFT_458377 [Aspergillus ellipticus CBS 707.79]